MGLLTWLKTGKWDRPRRSRETPDQRSIQPDDVPHDSARPSVVPRLIRTPKDAEVVAAEWMRSWGYLDAKSASGGPDGGIDVRATKGSLWPGGAVAQVKAKTQPTGRPEVQQLVGIARQEQAKGLFFSLGGYTDEALAWGTQAEVALFEFDLQGSPVAANKWAMFVLDDADVFHRAANPNTSAWQAIREEMLPWIRGLGVSVIWDPVWLAQQDYPEIFGDGPVSEVHWVGNPVGILGVGEVDFASWRCGLVDYGSESNLKSGYQVEVAGLSVPVPDDLLTDHERFPRQSKEKGASTEYAIGGFQYQGETIRETTFSTPEEAADWLVEVAQALGVEPGSWKFPNRFRLLQQTD